MFLVVLSLYCTLSMSAISSIVSALDSLSRSCSRTAIRGRLVLRKFFVTIQNSQVKQTRSGKGVTSLSSFGSVDWQKRANGASSQGRERERDIFEQNDEKWWERNWHSSTNKEMISKYSLRMIGRDLSRVFWVVFQRLLFDGELNVSSVTFDGLERAYSELVGVGTDDLSDLFTVLEDQESWHRLDSDFGSDLLLSIDVALEESDVLELIRELVKDRSNDFAINPRAVED